MKSLLPQRALVAALNAPTPCDALRDRRCLRADGQPKRYYLRLADAKANAQKYQAAYRCPSGKGFHIGSVSRARPAIVVK